MSLLNLVGESTYQYNFRLCPCATTTQGVLGRGEQGGRWENDQTPCQSHMFWFCLSGSKALDLSRVKLQESPEQVLAWWVLNWHRCWDTGHTFFRASQPSRSTTFLEQWGPSGVRERDVHSLFRSVVKFRDSTSCIVWKAKSVAQFNFIFRHYF